MPYKTIQQNFANGELNPKMQGRSDVDMYYKSAQKMRDVATTPYGGFVRRPGSKVIYQGGNGLMSLSGMVTSTDLTEDETHTIDKVADLNLFTYAEVFSSETKNTGTKLVTVADSLEPGTDIITYHAWKGFSQKVYAWVVYNSGNPTYVYTTTTDPASLSSIYYLQNYYQDARSINLNDGYYLNVVETESWNAHVQSCSGDSLTVLWMPKYGGLRPYVTIYTRSSANDHKYSPFYVYTKNAVPELGDSVYDDTNETVRSVTVSATSSTLLDSDNTEYSRESSLDEQKTIIVPGTPKTTKRIVVTKVSSTQPQALSLVGVKNGSQQVLMDFISTPEEKSFYVNTDDIFDSVSIISNAEGTPDLKIYELELLYENESASVLATRLIPFVFNNEQTYLISLTYQTIKVFRNDSLVATVVATAFTNEIIQNLRFVQTADTLIFVHPDLPPSKLVRGASDSQWTFSGFVLATKPVFDFEGTTPTTAVVTATPDQLDGTVKITLSGTISDNLVGQYMEGNGGRVKITSQNGTVLTGYTVIGFYSTDTIAAGAWTYTTSYEPVWSSTRGWPASVTFHGGRLWFGGSKSRPQTVWGSKVGLFDKFDPTSGYDNDAIEFTLDTRDLNKITDIYSQKNLMIFTTGGEFVCLSSFNEPLTPDNINAVLQTSNGSWDKTRPVDIEGAVMFIERRGQGLMAFAASENTTDIYNSANSSLINAHLIHSPVDIAAERNNLTQQTNYVYIVNEDGTMAVVNLLASQGITGGYTLWKTQGKIKNVCVLPDATYIIVSREQMKGDVLFIEKLSFDALTDSEFGASVMGSGYSDRRFSNKTVDMFLNGVYYGTYDADDSGNITFPEANGYATFGFAFRWLVQSNFLEIPQLGVGMSRKKRLATMTVRTLDTPELTVNGETQPGGEGIKDIEYYGIGDWSEKPTWIMQEQRPCKVNVMAVQMNVNFQVAGDEY